MIAAYKDLPGPVKELIDWDQQRNDVQIKYDQVIEQFQPAEILDPEKCRTRTARTSQPLEGDLAVSGLGLIDENGNNLLDRQLRDAAPGPAHRPGRRQPPAARTTWAMVLAGLVPPGGGTVSDRRARCATACRRRSPAGASGMSARCLSLSPVSVGENLLYGLKHGRSAGRTTPTNARQQHGRGRGARAPATSRWTSTPTGSTTKRPARAAGGPDRKLMIEVLRLVDLEEDVYRFGLQGTIDPEARPETAEGMLEARAALAQRLDERGAGDLVVRFDPEKYNDNATLAENLLFGTPTDPAYEIGENWPKNPVIVSILREAGPDRRPGRDGGQDRRDHGRDLRRPAAGSSLLRAVQLHRLRRPAGVPHADRPGREGGSRR